MARIYNPETLTPAPLEGCGSKSYDVDLNRDVMIWRIANSLYKDYTSGLRELVANAMTAVEAAISRRLVTRKEGLVRVTIGANGQLIIEDNGIGISMEAFKEAMRVMGNSTNFEAAQAGQFGIGFFAYATLSSTAVIETRCEDGTGFKAICRNASKFDVFEGRAKETRGTRITLQLYKGETGEDGEKLPNVLPIRLYEMAYSIGLGCSVPLEIKSEDRDLLDEIRDGVERFDGSGIKKAVKETEDWFAKKWVKTEDLDVALLMGANPIPSKVYLNGMPIDSGITGNGDIVIRNVIVNIRNERLYRPQPTREQLSARADELLAENVRAAIEKALEGYWGIHDYGTFKESKHRQEFLWTRIWEDRRRAEAAGLGHLADDCFNYNGNERPFGYLIDASRLVYVDIPRKQVEVVMTEDEINEYRMVYPARGMTRRAAETARRCGLPFLTEILKKMGRKVGKMPSITGVKCHSTDRRSADLSKVLGKETVVMLHTEKIQWLRELLSRWPSSGGDVWFVARDKKLKGLAGITPYPEWISGVLDTKLDTNHGPVTLREATRDGGYWWFNTGNPTHRKLLSRSGKKIIFSYVTQLYTGMAALELDTVPMHGPHDEEDTVKHVFGTEGDLATVVLLSQKYPGITGMARDVVFAAADSYNQEDVARLAKAIHEADPPVPQEGDEAVTRLLEILYDVPPRHMYSEKDLRKALGLAEIKITDPLVRRICEGFLSKTFFHPCPGFEWTDEKGSFRAETASTSLDLERYFGLMAFSLHLDDVAYERDGERVFFTGRASVLP